MKQARSHCSTKIGPRRGHGLQDQIPINLIYSVPEYAYWKNTDTMAQVIDYEQEQPAQPLSDRQQAEHRLLQDAKQNPRKIDPSIDIRALIDETHATPTITMISRKSSRSRR
jgi:hypothetical protein